MHRFFYHSAQVDPLLSHARQGIEEAPRPVLTPNYRTAQNLDVQAQTLKQLAQDILKTQKIEIAPPLVAQQCLREAIKQVSCPQDLEGAARSWQSSIQSLLRSSPFLPDGHALAPRARHLVQVTQIYQMLLQENHWIDGSELFWRALESKPVRQSLTIYGYFVLGADELAFIEALTGDQSRIYGLYADHNLLTKQQQILAHFQQNGWRMQSLGEDNAPILGVFLGGDLATKTLSNPIVAHSYTDSEAEARGVLAQVKQRLNDGVLYRDMVIVAANDREWGNLLSDIAWEYDIKLRLPYKIPIVETRVGAWVKLLLEVLDQQWPFECTIQFLLHPLSRKIGGNVWTVLAKEHPNTFESWRSILQSHTSVDLDQFQFPRKAPRKNWIKWLEMIFETVELSKQFQTCPRESIAYKNLREGLETLSSLPSEELPWAVFREEILTSLSLLTTIAGPGREGVELHNLHSIIGAKYDYVFVIDGREGNLPQPIFDDPVLDFYERNALVAHGIDLDRVTDLARREAFAFYALLHAVGKQLIFSYASIVHFRGSYAKADPSAYFQRLGVMPQPMKLDCVCSVEVQRQVCLRQTKVQDDNILHHALTAWEIEKQRESTAPFNQYDGVINLRFDYTDHWFSASQLTQLGQCPFRWFAHQLLKLKALEESKEELSPAVKGELYHRVLELALKEFQANPSIDITNEQKLRDWFHRSEIEINLPQLTGWNIQREEHIQSLQRVMQKPEFLPPGTKVLGLEVNFQAVWQGLNIQGRIDRIDRRDQGLVLIDYKIRSTPPPGIKDQEGKAKIDLQLPLYQTVAAPTLFAEETLEKTFYYSLGKGEVIAPKTMTEEQLIEVIEGLKTHFDRGSYPVAPDTDGAACTYCSLDPVCRKGDRLQHKGV